MPRHPRFFPLSTLTDDLLAFRVSPDLKCEIQGTEDDEARSRRPGSSMQIDDVPNRKNCRLLLPFALYSPMMNCVHKWLPCSIRIQLLPEHGSHHAALIHRHCS